VGATIPTSIMDYLWVGIVKYFYFPDLRQRKKICSSGTGDNHKILPEKSPIPTGFIPLMVKRECLVKLMS
jgi:hypothetical protein